jgi:hypothetical protein
MAFLFIFFGLCWPVIQFIEAIRERRRQARYRAAQARRAEALARAEAFMAEANAARQRRLELELAIDQAHTDAVVANARRTVERIDALRAYLEMER